MMFRRFVMMVNGLPVSGANIGYSYSGDSEDLGAAEMADGNFRLIRFTSSGTLTYTSHIGRTPAQVCVINGGKSGNAGGTGARNPAYYGEQYAGRGGAGSSVLTSDIVLKGNVAIVIGASDESSLYDTITASNTNLGGYGAETDIDQLYLAQDGADGVRPFGYLELWKHGASGGGGACTNAEGVGANAGDGGSEGGGGAGEINASYYGSGGGGGDNSYFGVATAGGSGYQGCVYLRIPIL